MSNREGPYISWQTYLGMVQHDTRVAFDAGVEVGRGRYALEHGIPDEYLYYMNAEYKACVYLLFDLLAAGGRRNPSVLRPPGSVTPE